jgi:hypothetical protein
VIFKIVIIFKYLFIADTWECTLLCTVIKGCILVIRLCTVIKGLHNSTEGCKSEYTLKGSFQFKMDTLQRVIQRETPGKIYIFGKSCTGKTTFIHDLIRDLPCKPEWLVAPFIVDDDKTPLLKDEKAPIIIDDITDDLTSVQIKKILERYGSQTLIASGQVMLRVPFDYVVYVGKGSYKHVEHLISEEDFDSHPSPRIIDVKNRRCI